jgi:ABC-type sugar transport system permease subunit
MDKEETKTPTSAPKEAKANFTPIDVGSSEGDEKGLDFSGVSSIAAAPSAPDPLYYRWGMGIAHLLVKLLFFLLGVVIDVLKGLYTIVVGFFGGIVKLIIGTGHLVRNVYRHWCDMDVWGRLSYFVMGAENLSKKQWLDGFVFLGIQVLFNLYMFVPFGGTTIGLGNLINFFTMNNGAYLRTSKGVKVWTAPEDTRLIFIDGFITLLVVLAFIVVYVLAVKSAYDTYQIVHEIEFKNARECAIDAVSHPEAYDEDLTRCHPFKVQALMRKKYGYSPLQARYIARVPFRRAVEKKNNPVGVFFYSIGDELYRHYDKIRNWLVAHYEWTSPLERFTEYHRKPQSEHYGRRVVIEEEKIALNRFCHTYNKYNDYYKVTRDGKAIGAILRQSNECFLCFKGLDKVSKLNNAKEISLTPKTKDEKKSLRVPQVAGRIVGDFETLYPIAKAAAKLIVKAYKAAKKSLPNGTDEEIQKSMVSTLSLYAGQYESAVAQEEKLNSDEIAHAEKIVAEYRSYSTLRPVYDQGPKAFTDYLVEKEHLNRDEAVAILHDYALAIASTHDEVPAIKAQLELRALRADSYAQSRSKAPFHGQPTRSGKRIKEFGDEKFAVTVLAFPVLAAVVVCVVPLLCSMAVAFTNWDYYHLNNKFVWNMDGWSKILSLFNNASTTSSYSYTFFHLLLWTIIWAFFATFTNYFFGIVLALLINRKSIKLKKMWRTIFVITIAIPQFISLLVMANMLSGSGLINTWLLSTYKDSSGNVAGYVNDWYANGVSKWFGFGKYNTEGVWVPSGWPFMTGIGAADHNAFWPKLTVILVNMWVGIPYTMLSTSGILMNIPEDLYESSRIDGAGPARQLFSITMPYVLFVTGPALLTQFIGNINNFNVIYFLTGGNPTGTNSRLVSTAGETDLLITWLYKLTVNKNDYSVASVIGILVFVVCAFFSLIIYGRLGSVKNEEEFQ